MHPRFRLVEFGWVEFFHFGGLGLIGSKIEQCPYLNQTNRESSVKVESEAVKYALEYVASIQLVINRWCILTKPIVANLSRRVINL